MLEQSTGDEPPASNRVNELLAKPEAFSVKAPTPVLVVASTGAEVLSPAQSLALKAALALTATLAQQQPVPLDLFQVNLAHTKALMPAGWDVLGWETGNINFWTWCVITPLMTCQIVQQGQVLLSSNKQDVTCLKLPVHRRSPPVRALSGSCRGLTHSQ